MADLSHDRNRWRSLLSWLENKHGMKTDPKSLLVECRNAPGAGKGLFALTDIPKSSTLFTVPSRALINVSTIGPVYPRLANGYELSAVQMVSLHLFLHKPHADGVSRDPLFGPHISTMPSNFSSHPCTWDVKQRLQCSDQRPTAEEKLLQAMPPSARQRLNLLSARFWHDWETVCSYVCNNSETLRKSSRPIGLSAFQLLQYESVQDFLWAWLNVNTRCIYYRIDPSPSSPNNMTLCPVLDFANHDPMNSDIVPVIQTFFQGGDFVFKSSSERSPRKSQEIFLRYGSHANRTLFVEYGFVNTWVEGSVITGEVNGEVDVQDLVEDVIDTGNTLVATRVRRGLKYERYWGDWTIHASAPLAHPSYRLITALRLYRHLEEAMRVKGISDQSVEILVQEWNRVTQGLAERISEENDLLWRKDVVDICEQVLVRAEGGLQRVNQLDGLPDSPVWFAWVRSNIRLLWMEELEVAKGVIHSVLSGEEF